MFENEIRPPIVFENSKQVKTQVARQLSRALTAIRFNIAYDLQLVSSGREQGWFWSWQWATRLGVCTDTHAALVAWVIELSVYWDSVTHFICRYKKIKLSVYLKKFSFIDCLHVRRIYISYCVVKNYQLLIIIINF